mgnify:FL=1
MSPTSYRTAPLRVNLILRQHSKQKYYSAKNNFVFFNVYGGGKRDRTADPLLAKQVLSQLSYTPVCLLLRVINDMVEISGIEPLTS